jgi:thioredoxin-like negative regulator of GroEL
MKGEIMSRLKTTWMVAAFALFMIVVFIGSCGTEKGAESTAGIDFYKSFEDALAAGKAKNQNVLIDFYTDWCKWCKKLDTETYRDSAVIALSQEVVFAKINAEVDTITAEQYSIKSYPMIVLMNSDGEEIDRIGGFLPAEEFIEEVNNYQAGIGTLNYCLAVADTAPTPELISKIGDKYMNLADYDTAEEYYNRVVEMDPEDKDGFKGDAVMTIAYLTLVADKYDAAIVKYEAIIEDYKGTERETDAKIYRAISIREKGDTTAAIGAFEAFLEEHPDNPDTSYVIKQIDKLKNPPPPEEEGE